MPTGGHPSFGYYPSHAFDLARLSNRGRWDQSSMKEITQTELLALLPKVREFIEQRLERDDVDGMIVFERRRS